MIRRLTADDPVLPALLEMIHRTFADQPGSPSATLSLERLVEMVGEGHAMLIEEAGAPLACVFTRPSRDYPGTLYFGTLAVSPQMQGRGLAHHLIAAVVEEAKRVGADGVSLDTESGHARLVSFHEGLGFEVVADDGDLVSMIRSFGASVPRRLHETQPVAPILSLVREAFAYMNGRIDPPSSMETLNEDSLRSHMKAGEIWFLGPAETPEACVFFTPTPPALYIGKLAVAQSARRKGHARALIALAETRAKAQGFDRLTLQARVELTENHRTFRHMGFTKTAMTAHPGYRRATSILFEKRLA
ncbi:MAG TPA: hypothetical protein DEO85_12135 [Maritimibacter sp.]|nr:hypothetical protein [Maritimibacter sp.]